MIAAALARSSATLLAQFPGEKVRATLRGVAVVDMAFFHPIAVKRENFQPAYLELWQSGGLPRRVELGLQKLADCAVCPRSCHVNRLEDRTQACKSGRYAIVSSYFAHFGEEPCLRGSRGSGTISFSWCNLRCVFCQNYEISG